MMTLKLNQFSRNFSFLDLFSSQISAQELNILIQSQTDRFLLIDVRSQSEYEQDHIPQAVLIPLTEIEPGKGIEQIQLALRGRRLIAYCTVGKRSQKAFCLLKSAGISGLNLKGGIRAWHRLVESAQAKA